MTLNLDRLLNGGPDESLNPTQDETDSDFLTRLKKALPPSAKITSGARTEETQNALADAGATRARGPNAPHVRKVDGRTGAVDIGGRYGDIDSLVASLNNRGFVVTKSLVEKGGRNDGTGPHAHLEFGIPGIDQAGSGMRRVTGRTSRMPTGNLADPSTGVAPNDALAPLTDLGAVATNTDSMNPDRAAPAIAGLVTDLQTTGSKAQDAITTIGTQLQTIGDQREAALADTIKAKGAILDDIQEQTTELQRRVTPIFAARAENAARMVEVAKMNPFKRALLGIFNPKYDMDHLKEVDSVLSNQAREVGEEFTTTNQLSTTLLGVVETKANDKDSLATLTAADLTQDVGILNQGWQMATERLSNALSGITAGESIVRAQVVARDNIMSQMTPGQMNTALAQAQRGGGSTVIGGVRISERQIQDGIDNSKAQRQALEQRDLAIREGKMDLATKAEKDFIERMTPQQRADAMKNGGMYRGVQLRNDLLSGSYSTDVNNAQTGAALAANTTDEPTYRSTIDSFNVVNQQTALRMKSIIGPQLPTQFIQHQQAMIALSNQWRDKILKAPEASKNMLRQQAITEIAKLQQGWGGVMDGIAQSMTRDPDAQIVLGSWFKGTPVTGEQSVRGVIALTRSGTNLRNLNLQGAAGAAFAAAQKVIKADIDSFNQPLSPQDAASGRRKLTQKEFEAKLQRDVAGVMGTVYTQGTSEDFQNNIVGIAKKAGDPAGKIDPQDYRAAVARGDEVGIARIAQSLGLTPEQVTLVFGPNGTGEAGYGKLVAGKSAPSFAQTSQQLAAMQAAATLRALDSSPSAKPGFQPSKALVGFMTSPGYATAMNNWNRQAPFASFGDMLASGAGGTNIVDVMGRMGQVYARAAAANQNDDYATARSKSEAYNGSPLKRMRVIISAVPGLNERDQDALAKGVITYLDDSRALYDGTGSSLGESTDTNEGDLGSRVDSVILHGKFKDPHLEQLRKLAAKNWKTHSESTDSVASTLAKLMGWQ